MPLDDPSTQIEPEGGGGGGEGGSTSPAAEVEPTPTLRRWPLQTLATPAVRWPLRTAGQALRWPLRTLLPTLTFALRTQGTVLRYPLLTTRPVSETGPVRFALRTEGPLLRYGLRTSVRTTGGPGTPSDSDTDDEGRVIDANQAQTRYALSVDGRTLRVTVSLRVGGPDPQVFLSTWDEQALAPGSRLLLPEPAAELAATPPQQWVWDLPVPRAGIYRLEEYTQGAGVHARYIYLDLPLQIRLARYLLQLDSDGYSQEAEDLELWMGAAVLLYEQDHYEQADYLLDQLTTQYAMR